MNALLALDHVHVGEHPALLEAFGEGVRDEGVRVKSGQRDELPNIAQFPDVVHKSLDLLEAGTHMGGRFLVVSRV